MIVYLDLDRTLFRTADFSKEIWSRINQIRPDVDPIIALRNHEDYFCYVDDLYYYNIGKQLSDIGMDANLLFRKLVDSDLADGRFEFEGVNDLVTSLKGRAEVKILTFGDSAYQRFKVSLCPSLRDLEVITTLKPKHEFFKKHVEPSWLVDDKAIGDQLPDYVTFIQVSLEGNRVSGDASWPVCTSLYEVGQAIREVPVAI